jgi:serine/threonine-protein kinase
MKLRPLGGYRGKNLAVLIGGIVVAFLVGLVMLNTFIGLLVGHGDEVEVPDLAGLNVESARERLRVQNLALMIKSERASNVFEAGKIVTQHPKPLARVKPGRRVEVIVSTGIERVVMPDLSGLSLTDARLRLADAGLTATSVTMAPSRAEPHTVVATSPGAAAAVAQDGRVSLLLSSGRDRAKYIMPEVVGRNVDEVVRALAQAGIEIGQISERPGRGEPFGTIIYQTPEEGSYIEAGDDVSLVVVGRR